eukprot:3074814-Amphidinium_carterae.1
MDKELRDVDAVFEVSHYLDGFEIKLANLHEDGVTKFMMSEALALGRINRRVKSIEMFPCAFGAQDCATNATAICEGGNRG